MKDGKAESGSRAICCIRCRQLMVSVADKEGNPNIITVAWAGTVCTNPPMVSIP